ncbi:MAG: hypothetical protein A2189_02040 [Paenibacillus sp. RIFOXYA1_FULL_44_5]|nr:MAG: hypothetical protein A2189_02040 [Paenibacillus sp. RIFOXYA1_FULL_44_5]
MAIRAVFFDFDGTLVDTLPVAFEAFQAVFKTYDHREVTAAELVAMFGPTEDAIIQRNLTNQEAVPQAILDYYAIYKLGHADKIPHNQEMIDLLNYLKQQGIKLAVITGKSKAAYEISCEALGMLDYFDLAVTGDDVDKPKPDPEGIFAALHTLGVDRTEAVFVGDSNADIVAGHAAGIRTYGVHWLSTYQSAVFDPLPAVIFHKISDFQALLQTEIAAQQSC